MTFEYETSEHLLRYGFQCCGPDSGSRTILTWSDLDPDFAAAFFYLEIFYLCSAHTLRMGPWGPLSKPPALPNTSTLFRTNSRVRSHPSTLQTPTPVYTIRVWSYATFIVINRYLLAVET
jgi:hypothetical protein